MAMKESEIVKDNKQDELQEEYLKSLENLEEGSIISGRVVEVTNEYVFVDVGYKSEGKIPVEEFKTLPKVNENIKVFLIKKEDKEGDIILSKKRAEVKDFWIYLNKALKEKLPVEGKVIKKVKGGFEIDLDYDIRAFNPISKFNITKTDDEENFVGKKFNFLVDDIGKGDSTKIILSRRDFLKSELEGKKSSFFDKIKINDVVKGKVKSFTSFGAFVDLGGFDGLLHINNMSWSHVTKPKDYVKLNEEIELKVIEIDKENKKVNLSLKHLRQDPWDKIQDKYNVDDLVDAKVTKLTDFGAFLELEDGIEGLAHISEMSWIKRISHPKELLKIGDVIKVKILSIDLKNKKLSLGIKQVMPNPWDDLEEKYPVGTRITRKIKKVTNSGAFIDLEDNVEGFLHRDDISWTKNQKGINEVLVADNEIEVVIIELNKKNRSIKFGVKQLSDNPWIRLKEKYPEGSIIEGTITNITDFGIFVKVEEGIEGLINKNNIINRKPEEGENVFENYKIGDNIKAYVSSLDVNKQKLSLSIKEYLRKIQKEEISKYIGNDEIDDKSTLAEMIKNKAKKNK